MNYTALQARTTVLVSFGGWSNVSPAPDYGDLVNRAYRELAWRTEFYHTSATFTTVANQSSYTLSGTDVINVYDAIYGGNYALTLSNSTYQRKSYALWTVRAAGAPSYYWMENPQNIRLYPTPPTTGTTVTLYLTR